MIDKINLITSCAKINDFIFNCIFYMESHKKQIVVFDFDCTLTKEHLWRNLYEHSKHKKQYKLFMSESHEAELWVHNFIFGKTRLDSIKKFLSMLSEKYQCDIAISSHGNVHDILRALKYANIDENLFKYIHGREELYIVGNDIQDFPFEKHNFIHSFLLIEQKYDHIVFIDDDEPHGIGQYYNYFKNMKNITTILMHNIIEKDGKHYINEESEKGMNEEDQKQILDVIQKHIF